MLDSCRKKTERLPVIHFQMQNEQRWLCCSICGSAGSAEITVCIMSFLQSSLTFSQKAYWLSLTLQGAAGGQEMMSVLGVEVLYFIYFLSSAPTLPSLSDTSRCVTFALWSPLPWWSSQRCEFQHNRHIMRRHSGPFDAPPAGTQQV